MTHSNLKVEVQGTYIFVAMRGTCFRAKYRKQEAPWLATDEYGLWMTQKRRSPSPSSERSPGRLPMTRLAS